MGGREGGREGREHVRGRGANRAAFFGLPSATMHLTLPRTQGPRPSQQPETLHPTHPMTPPPCTLTPCTNPELEPAP